MSEVTELGARVDNVQIFIIAMMAFWFIACNAVLIYFMLRYKRKSLDQEVSTIRGNHTLEIVWTVIPTILALIIFYYGIRVWHDLRTPPENAMVIDVTAQKWSWSYKYPNGEMGATDLYVPANQPVKLKMTSTDVIHSFFLPEFRTKEDVVPGMYTYLWFDAKKPGEYNIFCTEFCGDNHSAMLGKLHVLDAEKWERFINKEPLDPNARPLTPEEHGEQLYTKLACVGCHTKDGSKGIGPSFKNLIGRQETLSDGATVTVDENYFLESVWDPGAKVVQGYIPGQMPAFKGQLSTEDVSDLIAFVKTLQ